MIHMNRNFTYIFLNNVSFLYTFPLVSDSLDLALTQYINMVLNTTRKTVEIQKFDNKIYGHEKSLISAIFGQFPSKTV